MEKARYSGNSIGGGRGRSAFVNGRGWGRGRGGAGRAPGRGRTSLAWVRNGEENNTIVTEGTVTPRSMSPVSDTSSSTTASSRGGPVLKGPRSHGGRFPDMGRFAGRGRGRGRMSYQASQSKTWRRGDASNGAGAEAADSLKIATRSPRNSPVPHYSRYFAAEAAENEPQATTLTDLMKLGSNKLVLNSRDGKSSLIKPIEGVPVSQQSEFVEGPRKVSEDNATNEALEESKCDRASGSHVLESQEQNLISERSPGRSKHLASSPDGSVGGKAQDLTTLQKTCRDKPPSLSWHNPKRGLKQKRAKSPMNVPTIKRVKIGIGSGENTGMQASGKGGRNRSDSAEGKSEEGDGSGTLTDFAYRETSSNRLGGGRFSFWRGGRGGRGGRQGPRSQNMGLVRVDPEQAQAPICSTFLRGIRCEDELCTKRHDVPRESAMPFCSFFQRHGQCLKGADCPFRHVKVNPMATLCPSFNLLGYCNDEKCVMKHVTANKSIKNGSRGGGANSPTRFYRQGFKKHQGEVRNMLDDFNVCDLSLLSVFVNDPYCSTLQKR